MLCYIMQNRQCCDDPANLLHSADDQQLWVCKACHRWVTMGSVIEALRVRAVAADAVKRLQNMTYEEWSQEVMRQAIEKHLPPKGG